MRVCLISGVLELTAGPQLGVSNFPAEGNRARKTALVKGISKADTAYSPFSFYLKVKKPSSAVQQTENLPSHSHTSHSCSISGIFHWCQKLHLVGVCTNCKTEK